MDENMGVLPWWGERWHKAAFAFFLICWGWCAIIDLRYGSVPDWMMNLVVWSGLLTSLVTLGRQLPLQNVVMVGFVFGVTGGLWAGLVDWHDGPTWRSTLFWTTVLLNARATGQFVLRSRRGTAFYGWELMGVTAGVFTMAAALYTDVVRMVVASLAAAGLLFVTLPLMLSKRRVEPAMNWQPMVVLALMLAWASLPRV